MIVSFHDGWTALSPVVRGEIKHLRSGAVRSIEIHYRYRMRVRGHWPMAGTLEFDLETGHGIDTAREWALTLETVRTILGAPDFEFKPAAIKHRVSRARGAKPEPRQLDWTHAVERRDGR